MDEATRISLKDQFNSLLVRAIEGRRGGMALMRVLEELDFYNSPASAKHHLNVPGGLVLHSLNVARTALELCDKMPQFAKCNKGAVLTAALLHDVCKAGQYIKKPDGSYRYEDSHLMGHGEASVSIIKDWIFLTDTEALAIRWHMGAYSGEQDWGTLSKVYDRCPEALCLHMADTHRNAHHGGRRVSRGTAYYDLPNGERIELPTTMPDVEEVPGPLCDGKFELPEAVKEMFKWMDETFGTWESDFSSFKIWMKLRKTSIHRCAGKRCRTSVETQSL